MKKGRLTFVLIVFLIAFFVLLSRLFELTMIRGETYREFSDNNRIKEINIDATRGVIYDRNNIPIATNKQEYNLNAYSDRFKSLDEDRQNETLTQLVEIFENNGIDYLNEYFISVYEFMYKDTQTYFDSEKLPNQRVIELIQEHSLLKDILTKSYSINSDIKFFPILRMNDYLISKGKDLPIEINTNGGVKVNFIKNERYNLMIDNGTLSEDSDPLTYLISQVENDQSFIFYLISHPLSRNIVYQVLKDNSLEENIVLSDYIYLSDLNFLRNKVSLHRASNKVTMESEPQEDFLNLVKDVGFRTLLTTSYVSQNKIVVPASILINDLEKRGVETHLTYTVDENNNNVKLEFTKDSNDLDLNEELDEVDYLINLAYENNYVDEFILSSNIVNLAERVLFDNAVYPRIYKRDSGWEYSFLADKKRILSRYDENITAKDLFTQLRERNNIKDINEYISFGILSIRNKIDSQGYLAYSPINIAKNLNSDALIKIEENVPKDSGFEVVFESSRFYPYQNAASHAVGYVGAISEQFEIEEYVEYKQYDVNDIVGKTGLEQSFEDTLRGSKGKELVYTNVYGQTTDVIEEINAIPGNNLNTTIDIKFQMEVEDILKDIIHAANNNLPYKSYTGDEKIYYAPQSKIATAIVSDVKTGEILAMTSIPDYDPNLFVNGISAYDWGLLNNDDPKDVYAPRPILNNVVQLAFPPASTFKTVTALAALEKGLDPKDMIENHGFVQIGDRKFNDLIYTRSGRAWGNLNLYDALAVSSNYYFYVLGLGYNPNKENDVNVQVTLSDIESMTSRLGLQSSTGIEINIPNEVTGFYPNLNDKRQIIKGGLRRYLNQNLRRYSKDIENLTDAKVMNDISIITSWVDLGPEMNRSSVISELENLGYNAEVRLDGERDSLSDMIKFSYLNQANWKLGDSMNMVIGQGQNAYTPLQLNQLVRTIANDGTIVKHTLVKSISSYDDNETIYQQQVESRPSGVAPELFAHVKEGMRRAAERSGLRDKLPIKIGSKTGTGDVESIDPKTGERYRPLVTEIAFAPFDEPEIAIHVLMLEGENSRNASLMTNDIIYAYYKYVKQDSRFTNEREGSLVSEFESVGIFDEFQTSMPEDPLETQNENEQDTSNNDDSLDLEEVESNVDNVELTGFE